MDKLAELREIARSRRVFQRRSKLVGGRFSRAERRRLTLARAKEIVREKGLKRHALAPIWKKLLAEFPRGTIRED